jgi:hypothetical protein
MCSSALCTSNSCQARARPPALLRPQLHLRGPNILSVQRMGRTKPQAMLGLTRIVKVPTPPLPLLSFPRTDLPYAHTGHLMRRNLATIKSEEDTLCRGGAAVVSWRWAGPNEDSTQRAGCIDRWLGPDARRQTSCGGSKQGHGSSGRAQTPYDECDGATIRGAQANLRAGPGAFK